jgi:hypothetical protein
LLINQFYPTKHSVNIFIIFWTIHNVVWAVQILLAWLAYFPNKHYVQRDLEILIAMNLLGILRYSWKVRASTKIFLALWWFLTKFQIIKIKFLFLKIRWLRPIKKSSNLKGFQWMTMLRRTCLFYRLQIKTNKEWCFKRNFLQSHPQMHICWYILEYDLIFFL